MLKKATISSLALLLLLFGGCSSEDKNRTDNAQKADPNLITLTPIEDANKTITIEKTKNGFKLKEDPKKILIFDVYATWCPPCRAEAAVLSDIQKRYKKDVKVIGLTIEEDIDNKKLKAYKRKYNADYTLTNSPKNQKLIDAIADNLKIGRRFPIPLVAIYKDGKLVNYYSGATEEEFILSDIKQAEGR